jgi:pimeloyl-ACP methyl ester carboxylesterase
MTELVRRHHHALEAAGHRLHAEHLIPPRAAAGPTLVFLHEGWAASGSGGVSPNNYAPKPACRDWSTSVGVTAVPSRWSARVPTTIYNGKRGTRCPRYWKPAAYAEPPILFGHSDGGSIALLFAAAYPQRVRAAISEAAHVFVDEKCLVGIRVARDAYQQGSLREGLRHYHGANTDSMFRGWCDTWLHPDYRDWNMEAELPRIVCPVLIIQGEADEYGTRAQVDAIAAGISGSD